MNPNPSRFLAAVMILTAGTATFPAKAQQDAMPLDAKQVLYQLEQAETKQAEATRARRQKMQSMLQEGLAGGPAATKLYEEAVRGTRFEGRSQQATEFAEWKKTNSEMLRSNWMQGAILLHLRYLLLGLQQTGGKIAAPQMAANSQQYARDLAAFLTDKPDAPPSREGLDLLQRPARDGVFVRWLSMSDLLPRDGEWEASAGNIDGILETNVRAPMRKEKDPRLLTTWELQLDLLLKRAQSATLTIESGNLEKITRPRLIYGRAGDKILLGQTNAGQKDILQIIREYPQHPDWPTWVAKLRELLGSTGTAP